MLERREKLAMASDKVILLNGGQGTYEEFFYAIHSEKQIYSLVTSGGVAELSKSLSGNKLVHPCYSVEEIIEKIFEK
ncbi:LOG family protein [Candidatus Woesearchaeota archaeon]|nr:LOG family protein [Candidatus Woesearchaeota archaeon]